MTVEILRIPDAEDGRRDERAETPWGVIDSRNADPFAVTCYAGLGFKHIRRRFEEAECDPAGVRNVPRDMSYYH